MNVLIRTSVVFSLLLYSVFFVIVVNYKCVLPVHLVVQRTGPTGEATKVGPVFDATRAGLNELLEDLPLTLPTIREILRDLLSRRLTGRRVFIT